LSLIGLPGAARTNAVCKQKLRFSKDGEDA
jgi:hypothetical protein